MLFGQTPRSWHYYPQNTEDLSTGQAVNGLVFFCESPPAAGAEVSITFVRDGKTVTERQTLDTDRMHGERLVFNVPLDESQRHQIPCIKIRMGKYVYHIDHARSGVRYAL